MNNTTKFLNVLFLILFGVGVGLSHYLGAGICLICILIITKADKIWVMQDEIYRHSLSTQSMLTHHDCEASAGLIYNPSIGLQVSD